MFLDSEKLYLQFGTTFKIFQIKISYLIESLEKKYPEYIFPLSFIQKKSEQ